MAGFLYPKPQRVNPLNMQANTTPNPPKPYLIHVLTMQTPLHLYKISSKPSTSFHIHNNSTFLLKNPQTKDTRIPTKMKLFFVLAAASLLIVAAHATFLEEESNDVNPMRSGCRHQMRMMRPQLEECERYMTIMDSSMDEDQPMRRIIKGQGCRSEEECMRACCKAMREMDEECACEWMKSMVQEQRGEMGEEDMRMMMKKMRQMPSKCGMGRMSCPMGTGRRGYE